MKKKIILLSALLGTMLHANDDNLPLMGKTYLAPRSQSTNAALELVGWHRFINQYNPCNEVYGAFAITPVYTHSFRPRRLAEYFFGTDELVISGSQVPGRDNAKQILADYFGLSPFYQSTVFLEPQIRTFFVDFNWYIGWGDYYFRIHAPYVNTKWDFQMLEEQVSEPLPSDQFPALYMDQGPVTAPNKSFVNALRGGVPYGQVREGLHFGRVCGSRIKNALSEIEMALGWNFVNCPDAHAGFNLRGSIPTGTRPNGEFLFEPTVGNGHHWELGLGFTGHVLLWEKEDEQQINLFCDINFYHLFSTRQRRSFDLKPRFSLCSNESDFRGFGSRYMLMKEFDSSGNYDQVTIPVINKTTLECDVRVDGEFDIVIMASYTYCDLDVDLGYNAWLRLREHIKLLEHFLAEKYGLKGIQNVATPFGISNATQSTATLEGNSFADQALVADPNPPVFITPCQIDLLSAAAPRSFTHKIFGNISHTWHSCRYIDPFIGIGGEVEFEGLHPQNCAEPNKIAINQWGVWIKGGFGY